MPATPTTRYGFVGPVTGDQISAYPALMQTFLANLDALIATASSGTLAARPTSTGGTPGLAGRMYHVTDDGTNAGRVDFDLGTSWATLNPVAAVDAAVGVGSLRTLGFGAQQAAPGNTRLDQLAAPTALVGMGGQNLTNLGLVQFSTDVVANLYRTGAGSIKTDGTFIAGSTLYSTGLTLAAATTQIDMQATSAPVNAKRARIINSGGVTYFQALDDAYANVYTALWFNNGTTPNVTIQNALTVNTTLSVLGATTLSGDLGFNGNHFISGSGYLVLNPATTLYLRAASGNTVNIADNTNANVSIAGGGGPVSFGSGSISSVAAQISLAPAAGPCAFYLAPAAGNQGLLIFQSAGANKWSLLKNTDDTLATYSYALGDTVVHYDSIHGLAANGNGSRVTCMGSIQFGGYVSATGQSYSSQTPNQSYAGGGFFGPSYNVVSDQAIKANVASLAASEAHAAVLALRPISFEHKHLAGRPMFGLIAQEVQGVIPEAVGPSPMPVDGEAEPLDLLGIDYAHVVAHLIGAVQHLAAQIDELRAA